jgi:AraC-like DNA-binding protein
MSLLIQVEQVSASDRLDFVQEMTATTWVPMECHSDHRADYRGRIRASGLGPMQVAVMDILPITVCRTPRLISEADPDLLKMLLVRGDGRSVVEQGGKQACLAAAEFAFYDTRRPYEVTCGAGQDRPTRVMTFMFPPSLLPLPPAHIKRLAAVRTPANGGLGDLTSQFLLRLARGVDQYSPAEAARLSTAAMEILAVRLAHELDVHHWVTPEARRHAMLTTVQAFILRRLGDPGLSPTMIAAAHHVSLRTLHQLFQDEGLTVAAWIRQRRLERCRRDLSDPTLASRPVAAIAAGWGFQNAGSFSRIFRAAHGLPPAEYRKSALDAKGLAR